MSGYALERVVRKVSLLVVYPIFLSTEGESEVFISVCDTLHAAQELAQQLAKPIAKTCIDTEYLVYSWRCGEPKGELVSRYASEGRVS